MRYFVEVQSPTVFIHNLTITAKSEREARKIVKAWMADENQAGLEQVSGDFASMPTGKPRISSLTEMR